MAHDLTDKASVVRTPKPWGYEDLWAMTARYAGKVLHVNRGHQLSLQYHERKEETILLYAGRLILLLEDGLVPCANIGSSPARPITFP